MYSNARSRVKRKGEILLKHSFHNLNFFPFFLGRAHTLIKGKDDAGMRVAVKTLAKESSTETKENFIEKLALMSLLHHENILELLAVSTVEEPYGMIFEYMELGDLAQFLRRAGPGFEGEEKERGKIVNY